MGRLTLDDLALVVREELGRDPSRSTAEALVNEAGESWVNAHSWGYLRNRSQDLAVTAGVESYQLGLGVHAIIDIHRPETPYRDVHLVDFDAWTREKYRYLSDTIWSYEPLATTVFDTRDGDEQPRLYLDVFPVRSTETWRIVYEAGWVPMTDGGDQADLPYFLVPPFREWVRMYALSREKPEQYPMGALDGFMQTRAFKDGQAKDANLNRGIVKRRTGAAQHYARKKSWGHSGIYDRTDLVPPGESDYFA